MQVYCAPIARETPIEDVFVFINDSSSRAVPFGGWDPPRFTLQSSRQYCKGWKWSGNRLKTVQTMAYGLGVVFCLEQQHAGKARFPVSTVWVVVHPIARSPAGRGACIRTPRGRPAFR